MDSLFFLLSKRPLDKNTKGPLNLLWVFSFSPSSPFWPLGCSFHSASLFIFPISPCHVISSLFWFGLIFFILCTGVAVLLDSDLRYHKLVCPFVRVSMWYSHRLTRIRVRSPGSFLRSCCYRGHIVAFYTLLCAYWCTHMVGLFKGEDAWTSDGLLHPRLAATTSCLETPHLSPEAKRELEWERTVGASLGTVFA